MGKLLEINHCRKSFGGLEVLTDLSLSVEESQVLSIIGPSGSGKSTLLRCATLLETMDGGDLIYDGHCAARDQGGKAVYAEPRELREIRNMFGLVFQNFNLFPHYSVLKNIMEAPLLVQKRNRQEVCWLRWGWRTGPTPIPISCPAASSSGFPLPGHWP